MSFTISSKVPAIKLVYSVATIKAASRLREALCKLAEQDRQRLLVLMGKDAPDCADLTMYLFETNGDVRLESLVDKPTSAKLFCPDKLPIETAADLARYVLESYNVPIRK